MTNTKETFVSIVLKQAASLLLAAAALSAAPAAFSQDADAAAARQAAIAARYPAGSIQSAEMADRALAEVASEQARIEEEHADSEQACYPKFFTTSCLDAAKERRRAALALLRPIEIEANAFIRKARVAERDKALAEKHAQEQAESAQRAKDQQEREAAAARKEEAAAKKAKKAADASPAPPALDREAAHDAKLKRLQEEEAANAPKRAANVAAYEKKVKEAEARQKEVAAQKAERERERAAKAAETANKSAKP